MRKVLFYLAAAIALVVAIGFFLRETIALRLMGTVIERNLSSDWLSTLPDGLHVVLCGAGAPLPDPGRNRSGPCTAVIAGGTVVIVDAGSMGGRNLGPMGISAGEVEAVFLTHFHSDHIDGLGELAMLRWVGGARKRPLPVFGPVGVQNIVTGYNRVYSYDQGYRTTHHGEEIAPSTGHGMSPMPFPTPGFGTAPVVYERDGLVVKTIRVEHEPVDPAVGYRFEYGGRSVVISGDTIKSENLQKFSEGVDLLVHEALSRELVGMMTQAAAKAGRRDIEKITTDILDYHTSPVEAAEVAQAAGVGHLLFNHIVPPLPIAALEGVFMAGVSDAYDGPATLGTDGTMISLPSGSSAIEVSQRR